MLDDIFDFVTNNIRTIIAIGVGIVTGGLAAGFYGGVGTFAGAVAGGAVGAFTTTLIASGSVEAALWAGVFGALSGGLANSIGHGVLGSFASKLGTAGAYIAHGVAQGVVSILQGGKFGHGFASGFFGHLASGIRAFGAPRTGSFSAMMGRTIAAAVVGGTISQITGGKFANGAMTAAFVHLFNAESVDDEDISGFDTSSALDDFVKIFRLDLMDGDSAGVIRIPVGSVANVGSGGRFEGIGAPWRDGATPNSVYAQYSGKSGVAIKNAIYDVDGKYIGEVNFRNHGNGYVSGHGHVASTPSDIPSAHLPQNHLMPKDVPAGWSDLLNGRPPHTLLGD